MSEENKNKDNDPFPWPVLVAAISAFMMIAGMGCFWWSDKSNPPHWAQDLVIAYTGYKTLLWAGRKADI